jgi:thioredoxin-like negative regulator of GroEL
MSEKSIIELDDASWEAAVEKIEDLVLVMFYSPLCPHCMAMMPHFLKYAEELKGKIVFARIDVNKNPYSVERYGIMATPTFKFFCGGRPVQEIVGEIYPTLIKKIAEDVLAYGKDCRLKSTPIDYYAGYA